MTVYPSAPLKWPRCYAVEREQGARARLKQYTKPVRATAIHTKLQAAISSGTRSGPSLPGCGAAPACPSACQSRTRASLCVAVGRVLSMRLSSSFVLLLCTAISVSAQTLLAVAPSASAKFNPCEDTAPDCEAVCNNVPGNVAEACSLQTPIGAYLRWAMYHVVSLQLQLCQVPLHAMC